MMHARKIEPQNGEPLDVVKLKYDDRFRRRIRLTGEGGTSFILDLDKTTEMHDGDHLILDDGQFIMVKADDEPLMEVRGQSAHHLLRLTWHIGNRHLACEVHEDFLRLRDDHVIAHMLEHLGATVKKISAPFTPEGGAYGHGRTHSHEH